jgi:hypothetical protein
MPHSLLRNLFPKFALGFIPVIYSCQHKNLMLNKIKADIFNAKAKAPGKRIIVVAIKRNLKIRRI